MNELLFRSATSIAAAIRSREVSAVEVVEAHLHRIEAVNPKLNAVVQIAAERALSEARDADQTLARGEPLGPLHGVPFTIKDSIDTAGIITTAGTPGRRSFVPEKDASAVARLRDAGAILLGKTNTSELTMSDDTHNPVYGRTNNPYDLERSPSGSSGGPASIVAAGGSALDLGSDLGGSIREPAHVCGIAGLKPTSGRVPRTGHFPPPGGALDFLNVVGPMARYVEDLTLALPIIAGVDWHDPGVVPMPLASPDDVDLSALRIMTYTDNGVIATAPELASTVQSAAGALADDGIEVVEEAPGALAQASEAFARLRMADGGAAAWRLFAAAGTEKPGAEILSWLQRVEAVSAGEYSEILESVDVARSAMLQFARRYDAIVCPPSHAAAQRHDAPRDSRYEAWSYNTVYNLVGWPGAVVRAGTSAQGLPIGVQVVGRPWGEDVALAVAARIESRLGGYHPPNL